MAEIPTSIRTEDGKHVHPGDVVFNYYDRKWGRIAHDVDSDGWFHVNHHDGTSSLLNGARIATYDPQGSNNPYAEPEPERPAPTSDLTARYADAAGPGKFEGNAYPHAAAYVHDLTLDGQTAEETGSATEGGGWYGLVYLSEDQREDVATLGWERDTDAAPESRPVAAIVAEDTQGFVDVTFYDSEDAAQSSFAECHEDEEEDEEECRTRVARFTGQVVCTRCAPDCEHYICTHEDEEEDQ